MNELSTNLLEETKGLIQDMRLKNVQIHKLFKLVKEKKLYKQGGYERLIDYVRGEDLPFGSCFYCWEEIPDALETYKVTCSTKCQSAWFALMKPRQEERYMCSRCGCARKPHKSHKTGLCRKCMYEVILLSRRPDIENIGNCLDCKMPISRDAFRCRKCGSLEKWEKKLPRERRILQRRLGKNARGRVRSALKRYLQDKKCTTIEYLGCSIPELVIHIEKQFKDGMSWDNYGLFGWHIDHIRPIASFDFSKHEEVLQAFNHQNLQPLWAVDNIKKGAKYEQ